MTYILEKEETERFKKHLERLGFTFEDRPNQLFMATYPGLTVNLFKSGKVTIGGKDELLQREVEWFLKELGAKSTNEERSEFKGTTRIGTDEAGKGDFFGPIVVAGVLLDGEEEELLERIGVRDSKRVRSRKRIAEISVKIVDELTKKNCEIVTINPLKYNQLHDKLNNMNRILGWAHARAIENLLERNGDCGFAIADQFGDEGYINGALMDRGRRIELVQIHRAEIDMAVAAASILARDGFLSAIERMKEKYDIDFPRGAVKVEKAAEEFLDRYGKDALSEVAKMNFSIVERVIDDSERN